MHSTLSILVTTDWVQSIVNCEVTNVVVANHSLARATLIGCHLILDRGQVVIQIDQLIEAEYVREQVACNRVAGVLAVQRRRYVVEIIVQVAGVPVIADDVVCGFARECVGCIEVLIAR